VRAAATTHAYLARRRSVPGLLSLFDDETAPVDERLVA
jgi:hypothetical protein